MDNGDSLLDVIDDTSDLFGNQNDGQGSLFAWADEILGDETDISSSTVTVESGNLATNVNQSNLLLTTQNYAVTSSVPTQNITLSTSQFLSKSPAVVSHQKSAVVAQTLVNPSHTAGLTTQIVQQGNQQFIVRTPSGGQLQLNRQAQFQQQVLQPQQNIVTNSSFSQILAQQNASPSQASAVMHRSLTPNSAGLTYGGSAAIVSQSNTQTRSSPAPNVNLVHLPPNVQLQQQHQQHTAQQQQQFQIAPGTILQIPTAVSGGGQNIVNTTLLQQGQQALLGSTQQGTLVNAQNTVIQNPNVVNVNVAAQHVLCSNSNQQQRTNLGLTSLQTATHSPFNIQGTLIQTAEGKSILIPSQNIAQPINIQGLSVATPIVQPQQIQQPTQNTASNMLQFAQPQQQQQQINQGLQQIVLNHQGQQILVQRAQASSGQPQNIIVRTAGGQSGIVQLQQRAPQTTPVQTAQQTLQAIATGGSSPQLKIVNQQGTAQTGVPVINIGGQNVTLQQLSSQLGNIQGLQLQQPHAQLQHTQLQQQQQTLQQQQLHQQQQSQLQQHEQSNFQRQGQQQQTQINSAGQLTFSQGNISSQQQGQGQMNSQQKVNSVQGQLNQAQVNTSVNSVENQTRLILQQIHDSLKKSQASTMNSVSATVSNIQSSQIKNPLNIKQEFQPSCSSSSTNQSNKSFISSVMASVPVKTEANLIETLIKQENTPCSNFVSQPSSVRDLLSCNAQATHVTTTLSQASTQMSLFVLSNSQTVLSNSSTSAISSVSQTSVPIGGQSETSGTLPNGNTSTPSAAVQGTQQVGQQQGTQQVGQQQGMATLQTIHLPPELQQQFQRVQLEILKVKSAPQLTPQQKQEKLQQLSIFQKRILLKGRVLATTQTEPNQIQQSVTNFTQSGSTNSYSGVATTNQSMDSAIAQLKGSLQSSSGIPSPIQKPSSSQFGPAQASVGIKNLLKQEDSQVQPDSTSNLGQVSQSVNSLSTLLGSPSSSSAVNQQQIMTSNQASISQQISANQRVPTPSQSIAPPTQSSNSQSATTTTTASSVPQVAVPTQIKIADKVLTLSLTPAQKEKVQSYLDRMSPEQQLQYLQTQQHVLQRIQKQQALNAQIRAQVEAQKKQAALAGQGQTTGQFTATQSVQGNDSTSLDSSVFKAEVKTIPIPNTSINTQSTDTPVIRAPKRSYMDIPKGTLINQQIRQDQNHALHPDTKRPFRSRGDACRRLLRYHVFQRHGPSETEFSKFDSYMEDVSEDLLKKKDKMFEKFRQLLFQETLRVQPSSELVMLQRMQNQDLRKVLEEEKQQVKSDPELFKPMPMRFLCKEEGSIETGEEDEVTVKKEPEDSNDLSDMEDSVHSIKSEIKEETVDMDESVLDTRAAKMRKLVIKTDGMNFRSSFKRVSLDSSRSSVDEKVESLDDSETNDSDYVQNGGNVTSLDDDEDTNEYSNDHFDKFDNDEAERAALVISSAEDSQDTQIDARLDVYNIDNSLSQNSGQDSGEFFQNHRNFELTGESFFNTENKSKETTDFCNLSRHTSVDDSKTYIPKHSASVSSGSLLDNVRSISNMDDSDTEDKFDMYQPITESLTDSEENSYYSADNAADQRSVMIDEEDDLNQGHWGKSDTQNAAIDSDQESDQEVKAQMESAINSILSLSQGASNNPDSVYSYSQSNQFYNRDSQSNSLYSDSNGLQAGLDFQTEQPQSSVKVAVGSDNTEDGEFSSDIDAAVNSILM